MSLSSIQRFELKKFVKNLEFRRGSHTELVSVYVPSGYELSKVINHLQQEQGTAVNIKSAGTRKNVIDALERMIQHLRLYSGTPPNGLAAFSGNIAEREGQSDVQVWSVEPPIPIKMRLYRCDKQFVLAPLQEFLDAREEYGLVVMDRRDATIALLKGKSIVILSKTHSHVPGKFKTGGQCLSPDTIVQTASGDLSCIRECHNPLWVKSVDIGSRSLMNSPITDVWKSQKSVVYTIITKYPRMSVDASRDHTFYVATPEGIIEKSSEELNIRDTLLMPEKISIHGKNVSIDSKKYYNAFHLDTKSRKLLRKKRKSLNLLQKDFAKKIGVTPTTISSYELGKICMSREHVEKVCAVLGLSSRDFLKKHCIPAHQNGYKVKLPTVLDKDFAQFLGYFMGDGNKEKNRITLSEQRKEVSLAYKKKFEKYFGMQCAFKFRDEKNYYQLGFGSRPLVRLITEEFPELKQGLKSTISKKILESSDSVVAGFVKGLFDAEGYCSKDRIGFGCMNKMLVHQLQLLLLRFSIIASLHEYDSRKNPYTNNHRFALEISEKESLKIFEDVIGFTSTEKTKLLKDLLSVKSEKSSVRQVLVHGTKVREMIGLEGFTKQDFLTANMYLQGRRNISKQAFRSSILSKVNSYALRKKLLKLYNCQLLPVQIHDIKRRYKKVGMVDITVKNKNFIANGILVHNSARRFERLRDIAAHEHYVKVGDYMKEQFLSRPNLKGIILGGPGPTKNDFYDGAYITNDVKKKIIAVKDVTYTDEFGVQELLERSQDTLADEEVADEKKIMSKFFEMLAKQSTHVSYGKDHVRRALEMGAVDTLLLSEALDDSVIEEFEQIAKSMGSSIRIISVETREGAQLRDIGKIAAILRYQIE